MIAHEILFKCGMCEYSIEIKITLKKHMSTKHEVKNCDNCRAQFKTWMKLQKHMAECQGKGKKDR